MSRVFFVLVLFSLLFICFEALAADYYVNGTTGDDGWDGLAAVWDGVHGPKQTIQAGIDAAAGGDTVTVADGTYTGAGNRDLDFHGKAIVLQSANGPETCIIDCQGTDAEPHRGFYFHSGEGLGSIVRGLTIRKGYITGARGGAILCESSSPTVTHCVISENRAYSGGAIRNEGGSPSISDCVISGNTADGTPGIDSYAGALVVTGCRIVGNSGIVTSTAGGISQMYGSLVVTNCVVARNSGAPYGQGGIYCSEAEVTITNCTIADNLGIWAGGVFCGRFSNVEITGCILWGNATDEIYVDNASVIVAYCDVEGGAGEPWFDPATCIYLDPLLRPDGHLGAGSPCIDRGPTGPTDDVDGETRPSGEGYDLGADEFVDSDADGLPDWWEDAYYTEAGGDPDGDLLVNLDEYTRGGDPGNPDTDGDGLDDGAEVAGGTNPVHPDNVERTYYVSTAEGDDGYDGLAASFDGVHGPKATIQAGIDAALTGWSYQVQVADGTYTGPGNRDLNFLSKAITVRSEHGPDTCIIDCEASQTDEHRGFVFYWSEGHDSVVEGFTITRGWTHSIGGGAAIYAAVSSPTIRRCIMRGNTVSGFFDEGMGSAIYCSDSRAVITHCTVTGNEVIGLGFGGTIGAYDSSVVIADCTISGNRSPQGAGILIWHSEAIISGCTIAENIVFGEHASGGGIQLTSSTATISDCVISGNLDEDGTCMGGGIGCFTTTAVVADCTIADNAAAHGGGVCCISTSTTLQIAGCTISGNMATRNGGGVICGSGSWIADCIISGNTTYGLAGGVYLGGSASISNCLIAGNEAVYGGGLELHGPGAPSVTNCVVTSNGARVRGGGIYCQERATGAVTNCIVWGNVAPLGHEIGIGTMTRPSALTLRYSDLQGGAAQAYVASGCTLDMDATNIDADPLFVDAANGDFRLRYGSPCIDAGTSDGAPERDIRGAPRWDVRTIPNTGGGDKPWYDIGAYEYFPGNRFGWLEPHPGKGPRFHSKPKHGEGPENDNGPKDGNGPKDDTNPKGNVKSK